MSETSAAAPVVVPSPRALSPLCKSLLCSQSMPFLLAKAAVLLDDFPRGSQARSELGNYVISRATQDDEISEGSWHFCEVSQRFERLSEPLCTLCSPRAIKRKAREANAEEDQTESAPKKATSDSSSQPVLLLMAASNKLLATTSWEDYIPRVKSPLAKSASFEDLIADQMKCKSSHGVPRKPRKFKALRARSDSHVQMKSKRREIEEKSEQYARLFFFPTPSVAKANIGDQSRKRSSSDSSARQVDNEMLGAMLRQFGAGTQQILDSIAE